MPKYDFNWQRMYEFAEPIPFQNRNRFTSSMLFNPLSRAAKRTAVAALKAAVTMVDEGLFLRRSDPHDGRRVFVELAPDTSLALRRYFAEVERAAVA